MLQTQVRTLLDERSDLLVQIQDQQREITVLRRSLGFDCSDKLDLIKASSTGGSQLSNDDLKPLLTERDSLKEKIKILENELKTYKPEVKNEFDVETPVLTESPEKSM